MKTIGLSLLCLLLISAFAVGQQTTAPKASIQDFVSTGAGFLRACDPPAESSEAAHIVEVCMAYVLGVSDGATVLSNRKRTGLQYCLTPEEKTLHLYAAVMAYLQTHPEKTDARTPVLVLDVLIATFPCHPNK
jgi:hypothetical protein